MVIESITFPAGSERKAALLDLKDVCIHVFTICERDMKVGQVGVMYFRQSLLKISNCNRMSEKSARCKVWEIHVEAL
jgi:hypothetical protein